MLTLIIAQRLGLKLGVQREDESVGSGVGRERGMENELERERGGGRRDTSHDLGHTCHAEHTELLNEMN